MASQEISKETLGALRGQIRTIVAFKVDSKIVASNIGVPLAVRIPHRRKGLAVSNIGGLVQTYFLDKQILIKMGNGSPLPLAITDGEYQLAMRSLHEADGKMTIQLLVGWGLSERAARAMVERWEAKGRLAKDSKRNNARFITPPFAQILSNRPTRPAMSNTIRRESSASNQPSNVEDMQMSIQRTTGTPKMHWYEENEQATPIEAVTRAGKHYHQKYGFVPVLVTIPKAWQEAVSEIEMALQGLKVTVDPELQPRTVAITHISNEKSET